MGNSVRGDDCAPSCAISTPGFRTARTPDRTSVNALLSSGREHDVHPGSITEQQTRKHSSSAIARSLPVQQVSKIPTQHLWLSRSRALRPDRCSTATKCYVNPLHSAADKRLPDGACERGLGISLPDMDAVPAAAPGKLNSTHAVSTKAFSEQNSKTKRTHTSDQLAFTASPLNSQYPGYVPRSRSLNNDKLRLSPDPNSLGTCLLLRKCSSISRGGQADSTTIDSLVTSGRLSEASSSGGIFSMASDDDDRSLQRALAKLKLASSPGSADDSLLTPRSAKSDSGHRVYDISSPAHRPPRRWAEFKFRETGSPSPRNQEADSMPVTNDGGQLLSAHLDSKHGQCLEGTQTAKQEKNRTCDTGRTGMRFLAFSGKASAFSPGTSSGSPNGVHAWHDISAESVFVGTSSGPEPTINMMLADVARDEMARKRAAGARISVHRFKSDISSPCFHAINVGCPSWLQRAKPVPQPEANNSTSKPI